MKRGNNKKTYFNSNNSETNSNLSSNADSIEVFSKNADFLLDKVQSIANIGFYVLDIPSGIWTSSEVLDQIFSIDQKFKRDIVGWSSIIHPQDADMMVAYFTNDVLKLKTPFDKEYRIIGITDKKERWVHGRGELRYNEKGTPITMIGTIQDITERRATQTLLDDKSKELDNFFNAALDLLAVADIDGNFIRFNPEWNKLLGYSKSELMGHKYLDFVHPDDLDETLKVISDLNNQKKVHSYVNRYRCKNGDYKYIEWRSTPNGKLIYAAARDITERITAEIKLKEANNELHEVIVQKDKFLSIIAHDIRNPLNNLLGIIQLFKNSYREYSIEESGEIIDLLSESTEQLYGLIENLLDWALSKSDKIKPKFSTIDLPLIVKETLLLLKPMADVKSITMVNDIADCCVAYADENMVKTIFRNLVSNAIKFSYPCGVVTISSIKKENCIEICIQDVGIGIRKEKQPTLFLPHGYHESRGTSGERGSGLGLPLCKELIEKQGGTIYVKSEPNYGSRFYFSLQCKP